MSEKKSIIPENWRTQVKNWKNEYKRVKSTVVDDAGKDKFVFFRQPTRTEISAAEERSINQDTGNMNINSKAEFLMSDCYLGGDLSLEEIMDDVELFMPIARTVLYELVKEKKIRLMSC